jgi:hypothetical protein
MAGGASSGPVKPLYINLILEKPEIDAIFPGQYLRAQSTDCPALDAGCHGLFSAVYCSKTLGTWCRDTKTGRFDDTPNAIAKFVVMAQRSLRFKVPGF